MNVHWVGDAINHLIFLSSLYPPAFRGKAMAPHSSTLAWKIPWTEEPGRLQSTESLRVGHDWVTSLSLSCIGEGNGNPLQCSFLENLRDRGAWWAAIYGVAQSQTRLKWLSIASVFSNNRDSSNVLYVAVDSVPRGGGEFRIFLHCYREL